MVPVPVPLTATARTEENTDDLSQPDRGMQLVMRLPAAAAGLLVVSVLAAGCFDASEENEQFRREYGVEAEMLSWCAPAAGGMVDVVVEEHRYGLYRPFIDGTYDRANADILYGRLTEHLSNPDRGAVQFREEMSVDLLCSEDPPRWLRYADGEFVPSR